ncbi:MAG: hypothetical protein K6A72_11415 [Lachnospiraceae bacterium]|nr:hypothetical protein [Lachnospiraceae bacterium]
MTEKPTYELQEQLDKMRPEDLPNYFKNNKKDIRDDGKAFSYFMKDTIKDKGFFLKDVYSSAGLSETYGSKIISQEKHTKKRDHIIRLCVAGHFNLMETNRALKLYGMNELYPKNSRDACIIVAINNRIFNLAKIDDSLEEQGLEKLSTEE